MHYYFHCTTRELLQWLKLSQSDIARCLEIDVATVSRTLNNRSYNVPTQQAIALILAQVAGAQSLPLQVEDVLRDTREEHTHARAEKEHALAPQA